MFGKKKKSLKEELLEDFDISYHAENLEEALANKGYKFVKIILKKQPVKQFTIEVE
jgi:hypothetical protein